MWVPLLLLAVVTGSWAACYPADSGSCESPNVRTVLFRQTDLLKECWSEEELALLYARRLIQDLIPKKVSCNIPILLEYLVLVLQTAKTVACSLRAHKLLMMAIADAFGGYLQAYGLPQANEKYYEGGLSYCTAWQLNDIQREFRQVMGTDGGGWTKPVFVRRSSSCMQPFKPKRVDKAICSNLVYSTEDPAGRCKDPCDKPDLCVPLPFLDDPRQPKAIAVPFKDRSLYSLFSRNASEILLKYYSIVLSCIGPPSTSSCPDPAYGQKIENFVVSYHAWLTRTVLPHLHDEIWYPAFGGVYSIVKEMEKRGLIIQDITYDDTIDEDFFLNAGQVCDSDVQSNTWFNLWIIFCIFLIFWIIVCNLCCLLKYCGRNNECEFPCTPSSTSSGAVINSLVAMYCCEKEDLDGEPFKDPD